MTLFEEKFLLNGGDKQVANRVKLNFRRVVVLLAELMVKGALIWLIIVCIFLLSVFKELMR